MMIEKYLGVFKKIHFILISIRLAKTNNLYSHYNRNQVFTGLFILNDKY